MVATRLRPRPLIDGVRRRSRGYRTRSCGRGRCRRRRRSGRGRCYGSGLRDCRRNLCGSRRWFGGRSLDVAARCRHRANRPRGPESTNRNQNRAARHSPTAQSAWRPVFIYGGFQCHRTLPSPASARLSVAHSRVGSESPETLGTAWRVPISDTQERHCGAVRGFGPEFRARSAGKASDAAGGESLEDGRLRTEAGQPGSGSIPSPAHRPVAELPVHSPHSGPCKSL